MALRGSSPLRRGSGRLPQNDHDFHHDRTRAAARLLAAADGRPSSAALRTAVAKALRRHPRFAMVVGGGRMSTTIFVTTGGEGEMDFLTTAPTHACCVLPLSRH